MICEDGPMKPNETMTKNLDETWAELYSLFEERNFNKLETNALLIGTLQAHRKMVKLLKDNPSMAEDEFLIEAERIEAEE